MTMPSFSAKLIINRKSLTSLAAVMVAVTLLIQAQGPVSAAAAVETAPIPSIFLPMTSSGASSASSATVGTTSRIYWGAMVDGQAPSPERLAVFAEFEAQ